MTSHTTISEQNRKASQSLIPKTKKITLSSWSWNGRKKKEYTRQLADLDFLKAKVVVKDWELQVSTLALGWGQDCPRLAC